MPSTKRTGLGLRLAIQLAVLLLAVFGLAVYWVKASIGRFTDMVQSELVQQQSGELMQYLRFDPKGVPHLELPPELVARYKAMQGGYMYLLADEDGNILESSVPEAIERLEQGLRQLGSELAQFSSEGEDGLNNAVYGLVREVRTQVPGKEVYLIVGQSRSSDEKLLEGAADKTLGDMLAFLLPLFGLSVLLVMGTIYWGLRPMRQLSTQARQLLSNLRSRLEEGTAPAEAQPLVRAVNQLLDRLELSFAEQRHFTADTAHQLRTPLAVMQARLEHLPSFKGKEAFIRDIQKMVRLIQQLLSLAQLESRESTLQKTDLGKLAREVTESLVPLGLAKKVELELDAPDEPVFVLADSAHAPEALQNLIDNAIAHSPAGEKVVVSVTLAGQVNVLDRGSGITAQQAPLLFKRFWQAESHDGGAGLGLAIVAEIMRQHGGKAFAAPRPGGGSVFTLQFKLPLD